MNNSDSFLEEFADYQYPRKQLIHLALAESKTNVSQSILKEIKKDNRWIPDLCSNYQQLVQTVTQQSPDLILLGTLEDINWLEVCRRCFKQWQDLPIVLLVDQPEVSDFFRRWAIDRGVHDVVSIHPQNVHLFRKALIRIILNNTIQASIHNKQQSADVNNYELRIDTLTWESTLVALNRLTKYSSSYLGLLAIANYWKKTHASLVALHPSLEYWQVDYQAQISCPFISEQIEPLTHDQLQDVQTWVKAFLKECERVIVDFPKILQSKALSADVSKLISSTE
ncbi:PleD family two-component system response regulator [Pseudanabaena mucicola]|uniref:Response regulator n=1 Tax=Pseudanabaena mucicola FACHB-723 TaxID=2692860 RepID=A0ABR7ZZK2_9CYAN|nr:hypothetical protein [Pseudanabaena mucicola]MBD2188716.1 hypothetical protein [Pseudanabaena mucicola FACHB-723]